MGSWGPGSFENDPALDFVGDLTESADGAPLRDALQRITAHDGTRQPSWFGRFMGRRADRLTIHHCQTAIAAAEMVAALRGRPPAKLPDKAADWIAAHRASSSDDLVAVAKAAIAAIKTDSELRDEYDPAEWRDKMADLERRLEN